MKKQWIHFILLTLFLQLLASVKIPPVTAASTPFSSHGALSVKGNRLVDQNGKEVQLKGVSTHGISWYPQYLNKKAMKTMRDKWGMNTVRIAMYTAEWNGYCTGGKENQKKLRSLVCNGIDDAVSLGMYVIIDWHILSDGNPNTYLSQAESFFHTVSKKYKNNDNILYEICNEPNGTAAWSDIRKYAKKIIPIIRKNNKNAIILVGTPSWCQNVEDAAKNPLSEYKNLMYTLHFYANTHRESLRKKALAAVKSGLPLFVSEFSICDASGSGAINTSEGNQWIKFLNKYKISYIAWNLSNKEEASALIKNSCKKTSGWTKNDLSPTGKWFLSILKKTA